MRQLWFNQSTVAPPVPPTAERLIIMILKWTQMAMRLSLSLTKLYPLYHAPVPQLSCHKTVLCRVLCEMYFGSQTEYNFYSVILDVHALLLGQLVMDKMRGDVYLHWITKDTKYGMLWIVTLPYTMQPKKCCQQYNHRCQLMFVGLIICGKCNVCMIVTCFQQNSNLEHTMGICISFTSDNHNQCIHIPHWTSDKP